MRSPTSKSAGWRRSSSLIALALWALWIDVSAGQQPTLPEVINRASTYVAEYARAFATLVAEERYAQDFRNRAVDLSDPNRNKTALAEMSRSRRLRSSFMLVLVPGHGFTPFRDVFEVDGKAVRDRDDRLLALFLKPSPSSLEQAQRITDESARYNVTDVVRTINVPLFALLFLDPANASHFTFKYEGEATIAGRRVWTVGYRETVRPTIVKDEDGRDQPSTGRLWIEPQAGAVLQTRHELYDRGIQATITVRYAENRDLGILVPERMSEIYGGPRAPTEIRGTATYDHYQRVGVATNLQIAKPLVKPPG